MKKLLLLALVGLFPMMMFGQATATTDAATLVEYSSATLNATLDVDGGAFYGVEFEYSTSATFTTSTKTSPSGGANYFANQSVVLPLSSLSSGTTFYFRVLVGFSTANGGGITGSTLNFTTTAPTTPTVSIGTDFSSITNNSANNTGNEATAENGAAITDKGLVCSTSPNPDATDVIVSSGTSGLGTYSGALTGLAQLTTHYIRAYALNSVGYGYSAGEKSFTTLATSDAEITSMVSVQSGELTINFDPGSGDGCIVYMRENDQLFTDPSNGSSYTGNSIYGSGDDIGSGGNYVVFAGASAKGSVLVTNLDDTKDYYFKIATYSGSGASRNYQVQTDIQNSADDSNLPVELLNFTAQGTANGTKLFWATATEINNHYFQIEKSEDAVFFHEIGRVDGAGNSNMQMDYNYTDTENLNKKVYYRLRQVDFDGSVSYSQVITVDQASASASIDYVFVDDAALNMIVNTVSTQSTLRVMNMAGQVVREITLNGSMNHQLRLSKSSLPKGLYLITLEDGQNRTVKKVVL
jgi:hypothetical protein